jgi:RNA polymerase sigma-70 factor (ECF subfamily)
VIADDDLMRELKGGSNAALEMLFERYRAAVWQFFRRRLGDPARAEELAQEVFVVLMRNAARYEPRASFRSYLFGVAFNLMLAERRKAARQRTEPLDQEPAASLTMSADDSLWLRRALARLDDDDREILLLREYEHLTYQEIADLYRMPLNTVRTRLFRARMALKAALVPDAPERSAMGLSGSRSEKAHDIR